MADRAPINYDEFIATRREAGTIPFTAGGKTFHLISPDLMDDEQITQYLALMGKEQGEESYDPVDLARLIVDDYDGFVSVGGTAMGLIALMEAKAAELAAEQGETPGESEAS